VEDSAFTEGMTPGPEGCILRFFYTSARNETATNAEGRAIFDTVLMVDVITPGQKSSTPSFELERVWSPQSLKAMPQLLAPKRSPHYARYQEYIEKFKRSEQTQDLGGMPLKMWPRADRGLIATLNAANIFTVEQLADISDASLQVIGMGAQELREQARAYLKTAFNTADTSAATAKVFELEAEVRQLREALALANSQTTELQRQVATHNMAAQQMAPPAKKLQDITL
jgi:hypothetical protein